MTDRSRRRPWLAVLLALVVSGLGHAYLRRWARAFGWYAVITVTLVFFVPDAAVDRLLARQAPPVADVAPGLVAVVASVVDAYVLAVRHNRRERESAAAPTAGATDDGVAGNVGRVARWLDGNGGRTPAGATAAGSATTEAAEATSPTAECPHCGRETDGELDFCQWCTEPIDVDGG